MSTVTSFDTTTVRSWDNPQHDTFDTIHFPRPYVAPPRLPHGLRQLEIDNRGNVRVLSPIENIQRDSAVYHVSAWDDTKLYSGILDSLILAPANLDIMCGEHRRDSNSPSDVRTLNISTWGDTIFYSAQVGWIAYPEDRENIFSTSVSTKEVRPSYKPQPHQQGKNISFGNVDFSKYPDVFVAFNQFDIDCKSWFRLKAYVDNVSTKGLTWHIDSWADTIFYSAGVTIIAVN